MEQKCKDVFLRIILKMSTKAHVEKRHHEGVKCKHFDVSDVIYHKFSHSVTSYTLSGENINIMLESKFMGVTCY